MSEIEAVRPRFERVVREYLELGDGEQLIIDEDGDIPVRYESAMYFMRLVDRDPALVQVFAYVLRDVQSSESLLEALNSINQQIVTARVFWFENNVIAAAETPVSTVDVDELRHLCWAIGSLAAWADTDLQGRFGGRMAGAD